MYILILLFGLVSSYPAALQLVTSGKLPELSEFVTHHFNLDQVEQAFQTAMSGSAIKVGDLLIFEMDANPIPRISVSTYMHSYNPIYLLSAGYHRYRIGHASRAIVRQWMTSRDIIVCQSLEPSPLTSKYSQD